jgi:lipoate-protein ligase A
MMRLIADLVPAEPALGLALEEALFESVCATGPDTLRLWVNRRSIVVGRSQFVSVEVDLEAAARLNVPILRRISGGGTVYHYPGNLNVSLFLRNGSRLGGVESVFHLFGGIISLELTRLGIEMRPCANRLMVGGRKIAGAAQVRRGRAILYHTTLLVEPDVIDMGVFLRAMGDDYRPSGVASRPCPTTTLRQAGGRTVTLETAGRLLTGPIVRSIGCCVYEKGLTPTERRRAEELERVKYRSDEWNRFR